MCMLQWKSTHHCKAELDVTVKPKLSTTHWWTHDSTCIERYFQGLDTMIGTCYKVHWETNLDSCTTMIQAACDLKFNESSEISFVCQMNIFLFTCFNAVHHETNNTSLECEASVPARIKSRGQHAHLLWVTSRKKLRKWMTVLLFHDSSMYKDTCFVFSSSVCACHLGHQQSSKSSNQEIRQSNTTGTVASWVMNRDDHHMQATCQIWWLREKWLCGSPDWTK